LLQSGILQRALNWKMSRSVGRGDGGGRCPASRRGLRSGLVFGIYPP